MICQALFYMKKKKTKKTIFNFHMIYPAECHSLKYIGNETGNVNNVGLVKRERAFELAQNVQIQITLRMRKVSGHFWSIHILYLKMNLIADSEDPHPTAHLRSLTLAFAVRT